MRTMLRVETEREAFQPCYRRAYAAFKADAPDFNVAITWGEFPFMDRRIVAHTLDLDEYERKVEASVGVSYWPGKDGLRQRKAAIQSVREYRAGKERAEAAHGIDGIDQRSEALDDAYFAALDTLVGMPAPDCPALLWKLEHLLQPEAEASASWTREYMAQTYADMRRLLSAEA